MLTPRSHDRRIGHRSIRDLQVYQGRVECASWSRDPQGRLAGVIDAARVCVLEREDER